MKHNGNDENPALIQARKLAEAEHRTIYPKFSWEISSEEYFSYKATNRDKRVAGVLFGQSIGDALGLPAESKSKKKIEALYPDPYWPSDYQGVIRKNCSWLSGEYSDDTEQALAILDAHFENPSEFVQEFFAEYLYDWYKNNSKGIGKLSGKVMSHPDFLTNPSLAAKESWEELGKPSPNGAVMRTSYVGIIKPWDLDWTRATAIAAASTTHADPLCIQSATAVSLMIAYLVEGIDIFDAFKKINNEFPDLAEWTNKSLDELKLDEGLDEGDSKIGHTLKCFGAGFWALREFNNKHILDTCDGQFLNVLRQVIRAGGDTDTNAAVAASLMGAYIGFYQLPKHLVSGLVRKNDLYDYLVRLMHEHRKQ